MALTQVKAAGIAADSIDETKLADNSIDSEHYNDGSIDNAHLADDAVGVAELSATGTASSSTFLRGDNSWATPTDTNTQLSTEEVQDIVGAMFTGNTETNITATYEDSDGTIDLVSTDTTTPADGTVTEAKLNANAPTNDHVLTADSTAAGGFKWAAASGGAALTGSTDNTVCTVTGANAIQGEANLTFDGTTLGVNNATPKITLTDSDTTGPPVCLVDGSGGDLDLESDINNAKNDSKVRIFIDGSEKVRFQTGGGMSFNGDTAAANALDDYEEGTFTVTCAHSVTLEAGQDLARYCKIGRMVFLGGQVHINSSNSNQNFIITNLPFATAPSDGESTGSQYWLASSYDLNHAADSIGIRLHSGAGTQNANLVDVKDDGGYAAVQAEDGKYVILGGVYFAAT